MNWLSDYVLGAPRPGYSPFAKANTPSMEEIEALARKLEPGLAKTILDALKVQAESANLADIEDALKAGDVERVLRALNLQQALEDFQAMRNQLASIIAAGGNLAAGMATRLTGVGVVFDALNTDVTDYLRDYSLALVREITENTRAGIRDALMNGLRKGQNPRETAIQVRQVIGLTERQAAAVARFRVELETFHERRSAKAWNLGGKISRAPGGAQVFAVDENGDPIDGINARRLRDFRFDRTLQNAMKTGKPLTPEQIDTMVQRYAERWRKYRSQTIARTESIRALNAGAMETWRQAIKAGKFPEALVRRQWIVAKDERLCRICRPVPKLNPPRGVAFGQPFKTPKGPKMMPPLHPNCRCTVFVRMWEPAQLAKEEER